VRDQAGSLEESCVRAAYPTVDERTSIDGPGLEDEAVFNLKGRFILIPVF
jgi:hypothetical protein